MRRLQLLVTMWLATGLAAGLYGCSPSSSTKLDGSGSSPPAATGEHTAGGDNEDHGDHDGHDQHGKTDMEKMKESLANFSEADRESAEKQHFCPVTSNMLGTMGVPGKVDVNGQDVWICCPACKEKLLEKPDEYLAKLKE